MTILINDSSNTVQYSFRYTHPRHLTRLRGIKIADRADWIYHPDTWLDYKAALDLDDSVFQTYGFLRDLVKYLMPNIESSRYSSSLKSCFRKVWEDGDPDGAWLNPMVNDNTPIYIHFRVPPARNTLNGGLEFLLVELDGPEEPATGVTTLHFSTLQYDQDYTEQDKAYYVHAYRFNRSSTEAELFNSQQLGLPSEFTSLSRFWLQRNNYTFRPDYEYLTLDRDLNHVFFGMELEISTRLSMQELQYIVTMVEPKQRPFFYGKSDSSITGRYRENYIELVTMPCSPRFLKRNWTTFFKKLEALIPEGKTIGDYFDTGTNLNNGLHIHIGNDAFIGFETNRGRYNTLRQKSLHNGRFLTAFNQWTPDFQDWLQRISRRPRRPSDNEYCHVHRSFDGYTLARRIRRGAEGEHTMGDRHAACHTNGVTTEVRVWQGIFDIKHILSCIELTLAMINFTMYGNNRLNSNNFRTMFHEYVEKQQGYNNAKEVLRLCA